MRVAAKVVDVVHYGLGPIGVGVAGMVGQRPSLRSVAAVDIAPELNGKELGVLCGGAPDGVLVTAPNECPAVAGGVAAHSCR